jgi:hypothetical protein
MSRISDATRTDTLIHAALLLLWLDQRALSNSLRVVNRLLRLDLHALCCVESARACQHACNNGPNAIGLGGGSSGRGAKPLCAEALAAPSCNVKHISLILSYDGQTHRVPCAPSCTPWQQQWPACSRPTRQQQELRRRAGRTWRTRNGRAREGEPGQPPLLPRCFAAIRSPIHQTRSF